MRTAIVYCSQTGYTRRYASWLGEELGCKTIPYAKRRLLELEDIDVLVFCGWFHAASIKGARWLKHVMVKHPRLEIVVLATGASPMPGDGWTSEEEIEKAFRRSFPEEGYSGLARFYCRGGFDYTRLGLLDKIAMRMFFAMHEKNASDPETAEMLAVMREGFDGTRRAYLAPVLAHLQNLGEERRG